MLLLLMLQTGLQGQGWGKTNSGKALLLNFGYAPEVPLGDLDERFGLGFAPEISLDFITESNWIIGIQGMYLFGSNVEEDVLAGLRTESGVIIGNDRSPADIQLRQRGSYFGLRAGRLISLFEDNPRSGIRLNLGAGLLQHRIRIQEDPFRAVPQLEGEYLKGYDRLTNGLTLHQFVGYQVIGKNTGINITAGFEFYEGFTQSRRSFDFSSRVADTEKRLDILAGFRFSFTLPFYLGNAEEVYY
ncbi:hypothetical protein [Lewinella cohaerens]|uniref:hypothetical protein n=1 Tax=Lewinella cohaerens TaxID=70995 RepID=UPI00036B19C1|nr:hypothetical protein [Lewinella cohaerens]